MRRSIRSLPARLWAVGLLLCLAVMSLVGVESPASASSTGISGRVTLGNVDTPAGPSDASVLFRAEYTGQVATNLVHPNADGYYSIDVPPGRYFLTFRYDGTGAFSTLYSEMLPGDKVATVGPDSSTVVNATLPNPASITGRVSLGTSGVAPPVGSVAVMYRYGDSAVAVEGARTRADGTFTIPSLKAGYYRLAFMYEGTEHFQNVWWTGTTGWVGAGWEGAATIMFVAGSDLGGFDVVLPPMGSVGGTVTLGSPPVLAGDGSVTVGLDHLDVFSNQWSSTGTTAATDSSGRYSMPYVSTGTYRLRLTTALPYVGVVSDPFYVQSSPVVQDFNLAPNYSISGRVTIDGTPATAGQIRVRLRRYDTELAEIPSVLTDANGNYELKGVPRSSYFMEFIGASDYYPATGWNSAGGWPAMGISEMFGVVADRTHMDINIHGPHSLSGTVTDSSGQPAAGVEVHASGYRKSNPAGQYVGQYIAVTAADGTYDFFGLSTDYFYVVDFSDPQGRYSDQSWGGLSMFYYPYIFDTPSFGLDAVMRPISSIKSSISSEHPQELGMASGQVQMSLQVFDSTVHDYVTVLGPSPVEDPNGHWDVLNLYPDNYRLFLDYTGPGGFQDVLTPPLILPEGTDYKQPFWLGRGASQYTTFSDVLPNHPFTHEIQWMFDQGISTGYIEPTGQRSFRPTTAVTRQAMAAFLYRAAGSPAFVPPTTPSFTDVPLDHPFFKEIEWMKAELISTGYSVGDEKFEFRPNIAVSRQAMAAFLYRAAGSPAFVPPATQTFDDVPTDHSFYKQIEWMADAGISVGYTSPAGHNFKLNDPVSRQAMSAFLFRSSSPQAALAPAVPALAPLKSLGRSDAQGSHPLIGPLDREDLVLTLP